jgi:uncharacterized protein Smg (DUF494 family)
MISYIVEVLAKIAEGLNKNYTPGEVLKTIGKEKKYNSNTIAAAFSWIQDKMIQDAVNEVENNISPDSLRYFSEEEKIYLGENNYQYLMSFQFIGLITSSDIETILGQLKLFPQEHINIDTINLLIISLFSEMNKVQQPGSRLLLYYSDGIN